MGSPKVTKVTNKHFRAIEELDTLYASLRKRIVEHPGDWDVTSTIWDGGTILNVKHYEPEVKGE